MNPDFRNNSALLRTVSRHEMGHVLGLRHAGRYDDYTDGSVNPTTIPTMATCLARPIAADRIYGQDDAAALTHRLGGLSPRSIHVNPGFEDWSGADPRYWGLSGGSWDRSSSGTQDGTYHVRFKPAVSDSSYVYQSVDLAVGGSTIDARMNYKKDSSTNSGSVRMELLVRQKSYGANPDCYWPTDRNQNNPNYPDGTAWVEVRDTGLDPVGSSWALSDTSTYNVPSGWDAADLRVRVKSTVRSLSGAITFVRLDTVRARDRS